MSLDWGHSPACQHMTETYLRFVKPEDCDKCKAFWLGVQVGKMAAPAKAPAKKPEAKK